MITFKRYISILLCAVLLFSLCSCANAATKIVPADSESGKITSGTHYIVNKNTHKFHLPSCSSVEQIYPHNKRDYYGDAQDLVELGYSPCQRCHPY